MLPPLSPPPPPPFSGLIDHVNAVTGMMRGSLFRVIQEMSLRREKEKNKKGKTSRSVPGVAIHLSAATSSEKSSHLQWVEKRGIQVVSPPLCRSAFITWPTRYDPRANVQPGLIQTPHYCFPRFLVHCLVVSLCPPPPPLLSFPSRCSIPPLPESGPALSISLTTTVVHASVLSDFSQSTPDFAISGRTHDPTPHSLINDRAERPSTALI